MNQNEPLVSIIIPVFNYEAYLAEAIGSVLAQTYRPIEVIVVDDGSTDGSAEVANRFEPPVKYCFQPNRGIGSARNRGIELARGDFFSFLDADDLWTENKLEHQMAVFKSDPSLDAVWGHMRHFFSPELDEEARKRLHCPTDAAPGVLAGTLLIRRGAFSRIGPFETRWKVGEFIEWYSRIKDEGLNARMLSEVVLYRRIHKANQVLRERESQTDYVRVIKTFLDRRRKKETDGMNIQAHTPNGKGKKENES